MTIRIMDVALSIIGGAKVQNNFSKKNKQLSIIVIIVSTVLIFSGTGFFIAWTVAKREMPAAREVKQTADITEQQDTEKTNKTENTKNDVSAAGIEIINDESAVQKSLNDITPLPDKPAKEEKSPANKKYGNSIYNPVLFGQIYDENILNSPLLYFTKGSEIKYIALLDNYGFTNPMLVQKEAPYLFAMANGCIFHKSEGIKGPVARKNLDSFEDKVLTEGSLDFVIDGKYVYYVSTQDYKLKKVSVDGGTPVVLLDDEISNLYIDGLWLYFSNEADGNKLYRIGTDGLSKVKVMDEPYINYVVQGDYIYFTQKNIKDNQYVYDLVKYKIGGAERKVLNENGPRAMYIKLYDDWVYFIENSGGPNWVHRVKTNGTQLQDFNVSDVFNFQVSKDYIYYVKNEGAGVSPAIIYDLNTGKQYEIKSGSVKRYR
ncbi:MAG TPA: DUF5050 domain-containing protein [Clostridia bacterium]